MKKKTIAVIDNDLDYTESFIEYVEELYSEVFSTMQFRDLESYITYCENEKLDVAIISDEFICDIDDAKKVAEFSNIFIILTESKIASINQYPSIYKYQSMEGMIGQVMDIVFKGQENIGEKVVVNNVNIIGLYSPVGRCGKTVFGMILGRVMSENEPTLYINMEEYPIVCELLGCENSGELADLMYSHKQESGDFEMKFKAGVKNYHRLDFVPPLIYSSDLRNLDTLDWINLISRIASLGKYKNIILDIGDVVKDPYVVLNICDRIFMPIANDTISLIKMEVFESYLYSNNLGEIQEKIEKILLPKYDNSLDYEDFIERMFWGKVGDFARKLIEQRC